MPGPARLAGCHAWGRELKFRIQMIGQSSQEAPHENVMGVPSDAGQMPTPTGSKTEQAPKEWGGREGPEPTRYGDWEKNGRCIDF